jgi:hypothetical protein
VPQPAATRCDRNHFLLARGADRRLGHSLRPQAVPESGIGSVALADCSQKRVEFGLIGRAETLVPSPVQAVLDDTPFFVERDGLLALAPRYQHPLGSEYFDHLLIAEGRPATEAERGNGPAVEAKSEGGGIEIAVVGIAWIDQAIAGRKHLDGLGTCHPGGQIIVMRALLAQHASREPDGGRRRRRSLRPRDDVDHLDLANLAGANAVVHGAMAGIVATIEGGRGDSPAAAAASTQRLASPRSSAIGFSHRTGFLAAITAERCAQCADVEDATITASTALSSSAVATSEAARPPWARQSACTRSTS